MQSTNKHDVSATIPDQLSPETTTNEIDHANVTDKNAAAIRNWNARKRDEEC